MPANFYHLSITNPGGLLSPNDGFIDPTRVEHELNNFEAPPGDFTLAASLAKRRANLRYITILRQLGILGNIYVDPTATLTPGATYNTEASSITMTLYVEHGEESLFTMDESNPPMFLAGSAALVRAVARALIESDTPEVDVFDPTGLATKGNTKLVPRCGQRVAPVVVGGIATTLAAATALITVTKLAT